MSTTTTTPARPGRAPHRTPTRAPHHRHVTPRASTLPCREFTAREALLRGEECTLCGWSRVSH